FPEFSLRVCGLSRSSCLEGVGVDLRQRKIANHKMHAIAVRLQYVFNHRIHRSTSRALKVGELDYCYRSISVSAERAVGGGDVHRARFGFLQQHLEFRAGG